MNHIMICEQLGENGLCVPLNGFNSGEGRGTIGCQARGCEETCPIRGIMTQHERDLKELHSALPHHTTTDKLDEHIAFVESVGRQFQALPMLAGIRALGARFA